MLEALGFAVALPWAMILKRAAKKVMENKIDR